MKHLPSFILLLTMVSTSGSAQNTLPVTVLSSEKHKYNPDYIYLLLSAENSSNQRFDHAFWSCVFLNNGKPVFEGNAYIENIPPRDRVIKREQFGYGGPFDKAECRFIRSQPSTCP